MSDLQRPGTRSDRPQGLDDRGETRMIGAMTDDSTPATPPRPSGRRGDLVFRGLASGSGLVIVIAIALIGLFLLIKAIPSLAADHANFLTSPVFNTTDDANLLFGIRDLLVVTVLTSLLALLIAMPISLGIALFLTHYAPRALRRPFAYVIDLLAAVPSIVYGLWGIKVLGPALEPVAQWLNSTFGWFPLFADGNVSIGGGGPDFHPGHPPAGV